MLSGKKDIKPGAWLCQYHLHQSSDNPTKIHPPRRSLSRSKLTQGRLPKVKIPLAFHEIINIRRQQTRERTKAFSSSEWMLPMWLLLFSHSSRQLENIDSEWKRNFTPGITLVLGFHHCVTYLQHCHVALCCWERDNTSLQICPCNQLNKHRCKYSRNRKHQKKQATHKQNKIHPASYLESGRRHIGELQRRNPRMCRWTPRRRRRGSTCAWTLSLNDKLGGKLVDLPSALQSLLISSSLSDLLHRPKTNAALLPQVLLTYKCTVDIFHGMNLRGFSSPM